MQRLLCHRDDPLSMRGRSPRGAPGVVIAQVIVPSCRSRAATKHSARVGPEKPCLNGELTASHLDRGTPLSRSGAQGSYLKNKSNPSTALTVEGVEAFDGKHWHIGCLSQARDRGFAVVQGQGKAMSMMEAIATTQKARKAPVSFPVEEESKRRATRDELVLRYLPRINKLARSMARRLPPHVPLDDLTSAGAVGLLDAARRYDPSRCERFEAYAEHRIRGAMLDELRSHDSLSRDLRSRSRRKDEAIAKLEREQGRTPSSEDVAEELGIELHEYDRLLGRVHRGTVLSAEALTRNGVGAQAFADPNMPDPFRVTAAREVRDLLTKALDNLPDRLKLVASLYYRKGLKLSEIGARLGVTEARACQLRGEAVRQLREIMKSWEVTHESW